MLVTPLRPIVIDTSQAIWQAKVAPDVQGRVFSTRRLIAWITQPVSPILAGPLADFILDPAMQNEMSGLGLGLALACAAGYAIPNISNVKTQLPTTTSSRPSQDKGSVDPIITLPQVNLLRA